MSSARKNRLSKRRFNNLQATAADLNDTMDIDLLDGLSADDIDFAGLMFHRRHVYEHKGGVADEKYITDSGDKSIRLGQALRESAESAHRIANLIAKMARNLHRGFHEIVPVNEEAISFHKRLSDRATSGHIATDARDNADTQDTAKVPGARDETVQAPKACTEPPLGTKGGAPG